MAAKIFLPMFYFLHRFYVMLYLLRHSRSEKYCRQEFLETDSEILLHVKWLLKCWKRLWYGDMSESTFIHLIMLKEPLKITYISELLERIGEN